MEVTMLLVIIPLLLGGYPVAGSFRILGFHPIAGKSQQNVFASILHQLAVRGHSVVYVTPVPPDLHHPNLEVRLIPQYKEHFHAALNLEKLGSAPYPLATHILYTSSEAMASHMYGNLVAQRLIHSEDEQFDAVTMESYLLQEPVSALLHKFSCPAIEIATFGNNAWLNELAGLPDNPAYQISFWTTFTDEMAFWERLHNFYITWSTVLVSYYHLWKQQQIMDQYFNYTGWESRPAINRLVSNRSIILVNQDIVLGYPQPSAPHIKDIGGVNILPIKPLPQDLEMWMNNASSGVIYFSLGSNLRTSEIMSTKFGEAFFKVFRGLPQRILMKWEEDLVPQGLSNNTYFYKWVPQQDILAHHNCILFITHGGFLSVTEAAYYGVPLLGIPFFTDQPKNMVHVEKAGYGLRIHLDNVTYKSISWSINELLTNNRYREEARRRSYLLSSRNLSALDTAVYWIEHAIKYPNSLTPQAANLNFFQLHLIDIKLFILFLSIATYKSVKCLILIFKSESVHTEFKKKNN